MRAIRVNKKWLVDSFEYFEYKEQDEFNKPIYYDSIIINKVRMSYSEDFSRNRDGLESNIQGIIFCYASATRPFPRFKKMSKVIIHDEEYIIRRVVVNMQPTKPSVYSYELELV